jgi:predicted permease
LIDTLFLTLSKIGVLFAFIVVGFLLRRKNFIPETSGKTLSFIGTNVFFPAYLINNLSANCTREKLKEDSTLVLWGIVFLISVLLIGFIFSRVLKKTNIVKNTLIYIFAFSNYGYFGYPVMEKVFGAEFVAKTIMFAIPSTIAIASLGYFLLMGTGKSVWKSLLSPSVIAIFIGVGIGLSGIKLPDPVNDCLSSASACMSPVSMILTGFVLGKFKLGELFKDPISYIISAVRLIVMPLIFAGALYLMGARGLLFAIPVIITAMPVGMNTVMFAEAGGNDSSKSARICFISYIMGAITIPLAFLLASVMM